MKYEHIKTGDVLDIPYKIDDKNYKPYDPNKPEPKKPPRKPKE